MPLFPRTALPAMLLSVALTAGAQPPPEFHFRFTEAPGPILPGFRVVEQYDRSRSFHAEGGQAGEARPVQTLIWYPAATASAPRMTVGEYATLVKTETTFGKPTEHGRVQDFVAAFAQGTAGLGMWAVRDAAEMPGHFPVVVYAPGQNGPALENIEFCEYLASYGFLVIASPVMGASSRNMTLDVAGAEAGAQDISFELDFAKSLPNADTTRIAVVGYSWGAMSGLFAAARDRRIDALVSLDGSPRYGPATVQQSGDVHPDQMTIPLLVFSRAEEILESWEASHQLRDQFCVAPSVLNQWTRGDLYHLHMLAFRISSSALFTSEASDSRGKGCSSRRRTTRLRRERKVITGWRDTRSHSFKTILSTTRWRRPS